MIVMRPLGVLLSAGVILSCDGRPDRVAEEQKRAMDSVPGHARGCGGSHELTGSGIGDLRIGRSTKDVKSLCEVILDDTSEFGGEGGLARHLEVRIGTETVIAWVEADRIWRIDVSSPALRTPDSLGMSSHAIDLKRRGARYLGYGEGGPFLELPDRCGILFEFGMTPAGAKSLADIPPASPVTQILIGGCRKKL